MSWEEGARLRAGGQAASEAHLLRKSGGVVVSGPRFQENKLRAALEEHRLVCVGGLAVSALGSIGVSSVPVERPNSLSINSS